MSLQGPPPPSVVQERPSDPDELFCKTLEALLKRLRPTKRNVVYDAEVYTMPSLAPPTTRNQRQTTGTRKPETTAAGGDAWRPSVPPSAGKLPFSATPSPLEAKDKWPQGPYSGLGWEEASSRSRHQSLRGRP